MRLPIKFGLGNQFLCSTCPQVACTQTWSYSVNANAHFVGGESHPPALELWAYAWAWARVCIPWFLRMTYTSEAVANSLQRLGSLLQRTVYHGDRFEACIITCHARGKFVRTRSDVYLVDC